MASDNIVKKYLENIRKREEVQEIREELTELYEDETVKRFLSLQNYFNEIRGLEGLSDDQVFDLVIRDDTSTLEDIWLCYGKEFIGRPYKTGGYFIVEKQNLFGLLYGIKVAKYKNLKDLKEVIIPLDQCDDFEKQNQVLACVSDTPDREFIDIRRKLYYEKVSVKEEAKQLALNGKEGKNA